MKHFSSLDIFLSAALPCETWPIYSPPLEPQCSLSCPAIGERQVLVLKQLNSWNKEQVFLDTPDVSSLRPHWNSFADKMWKIISSPRQQARMCSYIFLGSAAWFFCLLTCIPATRLARTALHN